MEAVDAEGVIEDTFDDIHLRDKKQKVASMSTEQ